MPWPDNIWDTSDQSHSCCGYNNVTIPFTPTRPTWATMLQVSFISSAIRFHICVLHIHIACSYYTCSHPSLLHPAHSIPSPYSSHCMLMSDYWSCLLSHCMLVSWDMCSIPYWCLPNYSNNLLPLLDLHDQSLNHLCHTLQTTCSQQCVLMKTIYMISIKIWTDVSVKISLTWFISWNMPDKWSRHNKT
jgi:hypothetical protein